MVRFRLSRPAEIDLRHILATSQERWGADGRSRYATLLMAAFRKAAAEPKGPSTRDRGDLLNGVRSLHLRHIRINEPGANVHRPVHIVFYRLVDAQTVEIVRVLHERMEPTRHIGAELED